jgi:hypothetical protein
LRQAGYATVETSTKIEIDPEFSSKLYLPEGEALNFDRAVKLLALLMEMAALLDQPSWRLLKELNPGSRIKKAGYNDLRSYMGRYLSGDEETSTTQMKSVMENLRKVIAGMFTAIAPAARAYAAQFFYRFSPEAIKDLAQMERGFASLESKCWKKYCELAGAYPTQASIEKEIRDIIGKCAEDVMVGRAAGI